MFLPCRGLRLRPPAAAPIAEIAFVGQDFRAGSSAAAATVPIPAHQAGDLILAFVWHTSAATLPTLDPAAGFAEIVGDLLGGGFQSANTGVRVGWKYAETSAEAFGAHTSPGNWVAICQVFRPSRQIASPVGDVGWAITGSGNTVARYPEVELEQPETGSIIASVLVSRANQNVAPRTGIAGAGGKRSGAPRMEMGWSGGPVSSWPQVDEAVAGNSETAAIAIELLRRPT